MQAANTIGRAQQNFTHLRSNGDGYMFMLRDSLNLATIKITIVNNILNGQHFLLLDRKNKKSG
jgi:hypothetical protein